MSRTLLRFLEDGAMSDVTVVAGDSTFLGHKVILSLHSDYFYRLFNGDFTSPDTVTLDATDDAVRTVFTYMYAGCDGLNDRTIDDLQSIIVLADYLGITKLVDECVRRIVSKVDVLNCVGVYTFAETYHITDLQRAAKTFLTELLGSKEAFEELSQDDAVIALRETRNIVDRRSILRAILLWVRKCPDRIEQLKVLVAAVDDVDDDDNVYTIYERYAEELKDMIACPLSYNCVVVVDRDRYVRLINPDTLWSKRVTYIRKRAIGDRFTVVCMNNVLYCLGGTLDGAPTCDVLAYDLLTNEYSLMPEMGHYRRNASACIVNGYIYVVGGVDEENRLIGSVEYWQPGMEE
ncbi:m9 [Myxoma virus]|nr:m9 [Myxoma virus]AMB18179.1 m9 [Myxoma virus]AQT37559.1 m9 [Myxoma virus]